MLAPMGSNYLIIFYASLTIHIFATRLKDRDWGNSYTNTLVLESYVVQAFLDGWQNEGPVSRPVELGLPSWWGASLSCGKLGFESWH